MTELSRHSASAERPVAAHVEYDVDLTAANSLALPCRAERLIRCRSLQELRAARHYACAEQLPITLLGGGSNSLCPPTIDGLVVKIEAPLPGAGGRCYSELTQGADSRSVIIEVAAGVNWAQLVAETVAAGLAGLENLALIPGTVGAAPIQNIGAYGVELADVLHSVDFYDWHSDQLLSLSVQECQLGYRDSRFKGELAGQGAVLSVRLTLQRERADTRYQTSYPALATALRKAGDNAPTAASIARTVCAIRRSKLPEPTTEPNAGSFFKNPVVAQEQFARLLQRYPAIPHYPSAIDGCVKIAAAWLIEQCGLKGYRSGAVATHAQQPLVLVNVGGADLTALLTFAEQIAEAVKQKFAIALEREPQPPTAFVWSQSEAPSAV